MFVGELLKNSKTVYCILLLKETDQMGYETYVFRVLDKDIRKQTRYIMCVRYPNWQGREIDPGEEGFLTFREIEAGKDTWNNGVEDIPYKYNSIVFIKFIKKSKDENVKFIIK